MKYTFKSLAKIIAKKSGIEQSVVEKVLRVLHPYLDNPEDDDCKRLNAWHEISG